MNGLINPFILRIRVNSRAVGKAKHLHFLSNLL